MKRFASFAAMSPLFVLATAACGANITPLDDDHFKFTMLADFENGPNLSPNPLWEGNVTSDVDHSMVPAGYKMTFEMPALSPPRTNPDGTVSTKALHVAEEGRYTLWGTVVLSDLHNHFAVDLSSFVGISIWARSAGKPGQTVRVAFADHGSYDQVAGAAQLCDPLNGSSPDSCFDDYGTKIYPDGVWRRYDVPFSQMTTGGWGYPHPFDVRRIYRLKIEMPASTIYDLWFDDAAFYTNAITN